jgi:hypothetical protein
MARGFQSLPTGAEFGSAAQIRRAERTLHKDIRFMIRENKRSREQNKKGAGGVRVPDEFAELRKAKLDVSRMAADMVRQHFGDRAARMFRFRAFVRQQAWEFIPDRVAKFFGGSGGRESQSRHDEGSRSGASAAEYGSPYAPRTPPADSHDFPGVSAAWVSAAEGKGQRRLAHTAVGVATLMTANPDLGGWYRNNPDLMNRTRDLFSWSEQRRAEAWLAPGQGQYAPSRPQYSYGARVAESFGGYEPGSYNPAAAQPRPQGSWPLPDRSATASPVSIDNSRVASGARTASPGLVTGSGVPADPRHVSLPKPKPTRGPAL